MNAIFPPLLTTLIALLVYRLTLSPDLTWANFSADGGELISTAATLGIPHPPGYPTYILLGNFFSRLPISTVAFRFNLFSALCVALAAGLVTAVNQSLSIANSSPRPLKPHLLTITSIAAGLTFAFAPLVWGQATVSEVYALNLLCLALFLWALLTARPSWLTGLFLGLSLTAHLTSLLMLPMAILLTEKRRLPPLTVGILMGLTPYLLLPLLAQAGSPIVWGDPTTLRGWWWLVSGQLYRPNLFALSPAALAVRLREWAILLPAQFLWIGFVFVGIGAITSKKLTVKSEQSTLHFSLFTFHYSLPTIHYPLFTILGTAVLYLMYAIGYNTSDAIVFTLPALLLCAMLLGPGLQKVGGWSLALPILLLLLHFQTQDLSRSEMVRPLAEQLLTQAPPNALLLSSDEATTFTLWYFHHAEDQRPDLIVADMNLFAFEWYRDRLRSQHPDLVVPEADDLAAFQAENERSRPLCQVQIAPENETAVTLICN